ncbi:MAG: GTP-binding protein, partial [Eubacterium sp.]
TYRFKGFVKTLDGDFEVSAVGDCVEMQKAKKPVEKTELVAISAVGLRLYTTVTKASKAFLHEALKIL